MNKKDLLLTLLKEAVEKCYHNDYTLIERSMEQASVARIFYYMQETLKTDKRFEQLKNFNLDNEYNKNGEHIKETSRCPKGTRPDIILHKRNSNSHNMLIVEFKPRKSSVRKHKETGMSMDFIKLEDFTNQGVYNYFLGMFVKLNVGGAEYRYFQHGQEKQEGELRN